MTILTLNALGVTLGAPLFSDLSLTLTKGDRLGLVAANGRGKSTLMTCLAGAHDPTQGDITRARGLHIGHMRQTLPQLALPKSAHDWVLSHLPPDQADYEGWRVDVVLNDLQMPYELQRQPLGALSGGWRRAAGWIPGSCGSSAVSPRAAGEASVTCRRQSAAGQQRGEADLHRH